MTVDGLPADLPEGPPPLAHSKRDLSSLNLAGHLLRFIAVAFTFAASRGPIRAEQESITSPHAAIKSIAEGFKDPIQITATASQPSQLFVAERQGRVRVVDNGKITRRDLLDVEEILSPGENPGLSSIALPPNFATTREVYASYTDKQGDTIVGRFPTGATKTADEDSLLVVLKVVQPNPHLHRSYIAFGPEGYLYLALGDGPAKKSSGSLAQRLDTLFGKVLRLDVSDPTRYKIPSDNPYAKAHDLSAPEIWAYGIQSPTNISFDRRLKRAILIDSGEEHHEINVIERGRNYGWNLMEGTRCLSGSCTEKSISPPIFEYQAPPQSRAIGGFTYNGDLFPALRGSYIFADAASKTLSYLANRGGSWQRGEIASASGEISAIGEGGDNEIYVATSNGSLGKVVPQ